MKNQDVTFSVESSSMQDVPKGMKNIIKLVLEVYDVDIKQVDNTTYQFIGVSGQVSKAVSMLKIAVEQAMHAQLTGKNSFDVPFAGTLDDFLNRTEPASSNDPKLNQDEENVKVGVNQDDTEGGNLTLSQLVTVDDDELDDLQTHAGSQASVDVDLSGLAEFFSTPVAATLINDGAAFEKPVLNSTMYTIFGDVSSYEVISGNLGTSDNDVILDRDQDKSKDDGISFIPNTPPVAEDDEITLFEGQIVNIYETVLFNDLDNDTLFIDSLSGVTGLNGTITLDSDGRTLFYEAGSYFDFYAAGETHTEFFTYHIVDGRGGEHTATITVTVIGVNDAPIAQDDVALIADDSTNVNGNVLADNGNGADSDVDASDVISVSAVLGGNVGVASAGTDGGLFTINADGTFNFNPNGDFAYLDTGETQDTTVQYTIDDGNGGTDTATITITVTGVNDGPVAQDDDFAVQESASVSGDIFADNGNGVDNDVDDTDSFSITAVDGNAGDVGASVAGSAGGLFTINSDGTFDFDPNGEFEYLSQNQTVDTTVQYTITDNSGATSTATVTVTLTGENDSFTGNDDAVSINENVTLNLHGTLLSNDVDIDTNDVLNITAVDTSGTNGTVAFNDGANTLTYTASNFEELAVGQTATDTLIYTVTDGYGVTQDVTVTFTVTGVNDDPVAQDDYGTVDEDNTFSANVFADNGNGADSDIDTGDTFVVSAVSGGSVGSASAGSDGGLFTINSNGALTFDPNGDFEYLAVGESQDTTITYTINDGNGGTDTATVTITVTGVNDDPVGNADGVAIDENEITANLHTTLLSNDTDVDVSDVLNIIAVDTSATTGFVTFNDDANILLYSASGFDHLGEGVTATDTFVYTVSDGNGGTQDVTVTVTVTGVNDDPTAQEDLFTTGENATFSGGNVLADNGNGVDSDADTGDVVSVSGVVDGTLGVAIAGSNGGLFTINADGSISFDPNGEFESLAIGESLDTVAYYTVEDGNGGESIGTVTMTVTGSNDAVTARDDALTTDEDSIFNGSVLQNNGSGADSDIDTNDTLSVSGVTGGSVGSAISGSSGGLFTINADGSISFDPNGDFDYLAIGESVDTTVEYTVTDGNGSTDTATVTMTVTAQNDAPDAVDDQLNITSDSTYSGNVLVDNLYGADSDPDTNDTLSVVGVTGGSVGVAIAGSNGGLFTINADGSITFDPNSEFDFLGSSDSLDTTVEYTISDGNGGTDTATVTMTVTGGSLIAEDDGLIGEVAEDSQTLIINESDLLFNDITADALTIDIISMVADAGQGSLSDNGDGTWTYTSPADSLPFSGEANITYTAQDSAGATDTATFQLRVFNTITGTAGGDVMVAEDNSVPHKFWGLAGNDTITGSNERDLLIGGADDDNISGGDGDDDFIFEGTGNGVDVIDGGAGTDRVIGGTGDDTFTVLSFTGIEEIDMGAGTDTLAGTAGDDTFVFGTVTITNLEVIDGGAGTNIISGTASDDSYDLSNVTTITNINYIDMGAGNDTLMGSADADTILVGAGDNNLSGGAGGDTFIIDATATGANIINGGAGYDQITGTADDTTLTLSSLISIEYIDLGAGNNVLRADVDGSLDISAYTLGVDLIGVAYITDNTGTESVIGTDQADTIVMTADTNADSFSGRDGDDTFSFSGAVDGGDSVDGGLGNDQIIGSSGNDTLTLSTISSIEYIDFGAGTDTMRASVDGTLDVSSYTVGVDLVGLERLSDNTGTESVIGTDQADTIVMTADTNADSFSGRDGDDTFSFSGAVDGGDSVDGGVGNDQIVGSSGNDTLTLSTISSIEYIDFGAGTDTMRASVDGTLDVSSYTVGVDLVGLERLSDNTGAESVIGTDQDDTIVMTADTNADSFSGRDGDDTFSFSGSVNGGDIIDGGLGNDQIMGSGGSDTLRLSSLTGVESIDFGSGDDSFVVYTALDFTGMVIDMGAGTDYLRAHTNNTLDMSTYTLGVEFLNLEYITDSSGSETVIGTNQADTIWMTNDYSADTFSGNDGDDVFNFSGNIHRSDSIDGGAGNDRINGSSGNDTLLLSSLTNVEYVDFGAGDDAFVTRAGMTPGGFTIDMGDGIDYMMAQFHNTLDIAGYTLGVDLLGLEYITDNTGGETIIATNQNDEIRIKDDLYADSFYGLGGDDIFTFSGDIDRNDRIDGGDGYDQLLGDDGDNTLVLVSLLNIEYIDLGAGTNYIRASSSGSIDLSGYTIGVDLIGVDYLTDNANAETITATNQADLIVMRDDLYADTFYGLDGDDTFSFSGNIDHNDRIYGGAGNDQLIGSDGDDSLLLRVMDSIEYIDMGAGTDFIRVYSTGTLDLSAYTVGVDLVGLEYIIDNSNAETITATNQNDEIRLTDDLYADVFYGLDGDDIFRFSGDIDHNDRIFGGDGFDSLIGSSGNDSLLLRDMDSIEYIDMGAGTDFIRSYSNGTLDISAYTVGVDFIGVEYIIDNTGTETITGTAQADEIQMNSDSNADTFNGGDGDDTFRFSGNVNGGDLVYGGAGTDQIIGSNGNNGLTLSVFDSIELIDLGAGNDYMRANTNGSLDLSAYTVGVDLLGVEYFTDNNGTETIIGTAQADEILMNGDGYADTFNGGDGDDTFTFNGNVNGGDRVYGGAGTDQIIGSDNDNGLTLSVIDSIELIDLGAGTDYIRASSTGSLDLSGYTVGVDLLGVEYITDNGNAETVTGTAQADEIHLNADTYADTFNGGDGDDTFVVNGAVNGGDRIYGGLGTNVITATASNDILNVTVLDDISSIDFGDGDDGFIIGSSVSLAGMVVDMGIGTDYIGARSGGTLDLSSYTLGVDILNLEYIQDSTGAETITGTAQADVIHMQEDTYADTFNGGDGDDTFVVTGAVNGGDRIHGGLGTNIITATAGNDILNVTALSDISSIDFGDGDDMFLFSSSVSLTGIVIDMGAGVDHIRARADDTLDLSSYTLGVDILNLDYIRDNSGVETITGTAQNDEIHMNADTEADTFNGGDGDDNFVVSGAVNGGDRIFGGAGTNTITGSSGSDILNVTALSGISSIDFGSGADGFLFSSAISLAGMVVDMGAGTDYIRAQIDDILDLSSYTLGVDILNLEYIRDNTGAETITGTAQNDEIHLTADNEADTFNGGDGDDVFVVNGSVNGGDIIDGGAGTNTITGSSGTDLLYVSSLTNISSIDFGAGDDGFIYESSISLAGVVVDMGAGTDYIRASRGDTLDLSALTLGVDILNLEYITDNTGTETVIGTDQADEIHMTADNRADTFNGGGGDDTFVVSGAVNGGDIIDGGAGTNVITGSGGDDTLYVSSMSNINSIDFGAGNDGFIFDSSVSLTGVVVDMGAGTDYIAAAVNDTLDLSALTLGVDILNLEYITDSTGSETIMGTDQADEIHMTADNNSDVIYGNDGADLIYVIGQMGAADTLADFDSVEGDVLDISDIISYDSGAGDLIEDFIRMTDSGDGDASNGSGTVTVSIDVDGALNGENFQDYFVFSDQGLDLTTLISNGNLLVE